MQNNPLDATIFTLELRKKSFTVNFDSQSLIQLKLIFQIFVSCLFTEKRKLIKIYVPKLN